MFLPPLLLLYNPLCSLSYVLCLLLSIPLLSQLLSPHILPPFYSLLISSSLCSICALSLSVLFPTSLIAFSCYLSLVYPLFDVSCSLYTPLHALLAFILSASPLISLFSLCLYFSTLLQSPPSLCTNPLNLPLVARRGPPIYHLAVAIPVGALMIKCTNRRSNEWALHTI